MDVCCAKIRGCSCSAAGFLPRIRRALSGPIPPLRLQATVVAFRMTKARLLADQARKLQCVLGLFRPIVPSYNNAWANHRLLGACAELSKFEAQRTGFFPSLQATLNHIYVIDLFYIEALEGGWLGPTALENPIPFPAVAELSEAQASVDKRLIDVSGDATRLTKRRGADQSRCSCPS
jgi:hypothetical protein